MNLRIEQSLFGLIPHVISDCWNWLVLSPGRQKGRAMEKQKKHLAATVPLAIIYFVAGKLGLTKALMHPSATAVWPCTGIALAAFLILGYDLWPGILLAAFLVNITTTGSVATCLGIATGNTLEGLAGAHLVNRFACGRNAMQRPQDVFKFAGLAGMLSTSISATFGVASLALAGYASWANYGDIWTTWWLGDASSLRRGLSRHSIAWVSRIGVRPTITRRATATLNGSIAA